MKSLTVLSGKGGTGKTTLTANLAVLAQNLVVADCDVDAPNLHLLLEGEILAQDIYQGAKLAVKDEDLCIDCGICRELCNFRAINSDNQINPIKCEGCGLCVAKCPVNALKLELQDTGKLFHSIIQIGSMIHAKLKIGAENSGKLVSRVKEEAQKVAKKRNKELVLVDGSPGIGCPVIASLNGADAVLLVTEPTKSGLADLKRVLEVVDHFNILPLLVINKYDLNQDLALEMEAFCKENEISLVGKIPFADTIVKAMEQGELVVDYAPDSEVARAIREIWVQTKEKLSILL
ncbi:4Fe-4S binding protein [Natroniella acetigena]|uniref:ATP-binding protein n=1 Tax=Natroniella acetigena TaxID=52004 RepID=UPI00200B9A6C|nr:ATP-binding protein [Natroniella acetigena]MCK8827661.1 4Fe-4S binding protein [Natroniella acetigena]